jgi:predicted signal transduction protein with EAL and GGDEF domain
VVARSGGDEFVVLLPGSATAEASAISERILGAIALQNETLAGQFEVSIGIAELGAKADSNDALAAADAALYRAKAAGGGQAAVAQPEPDDSRGQHFTLREAGLFIRSRAFLGGVRGDRVGRVLRPVPVFE